MSLRKTRQNSENNINVQYNRLNYLIISLALLFIVQIVCLINIKLNDINSKKCESNQQTQMLETNREKILRYWGVNIAQWNPLGNLRSMDRVFEGLQYKFVNASFGDDWDILWSIEHPYAEKHANQTLFVGMSRKNLRLEQKINHFPGISPLTSKTFMNHLNSHLPYILPSFVLPRHRKKLEKFIENNPNAKFVEKNAHNRGVRVVNIKKITNRKHEVFYQQFMDKPFLIDGHAFDFGIYVLITSFDPVRIYKYDADILIRFCEDKYHPFDPQDRSKYVVKEGSLPPNILPTFKEIYERNKYPFRQIFERHVESKGCNLRELWRKIDDAIVSTVLKAEFLVIKRLRDRNFSSHHFFELVRYDFMLDENFNLYLMEVNMSPNITPTNELHKEYTSIYEQLVFNVLKMIGGGSYFEFMSRFNESDITIASSKNIAAGIDSCLKYECHRNCSQAECKICPPCVNSQNRYQMREAFREQLYEGNFKRIFPVRSHYDDEKLYDSMTENNQISIKWYKAKCIDDEKWC